MTPLDRAAYSLALHSPYAWMCRQWTRRDQRDRQRERPHKWFEGAPALASLSREGTCLCVCWCALFSLSLYIYHYHMIIITFLFQHTNASSRRCTRAASTSDTTDEQGTFFPDPCMASTDRAKLASRQPCLQQRTSCVERLGRTKAVMAMRSSPFAMRRLHLPRQRARSVGATSILYDDGRV